MLIGRTLALRTAAWIRSGAAYRTDRQGRIPGARRLALPRLAATRAARVARGAWRAKDDLPTQRGARNSSTKRGNGKPRVRRLPGYCKRLQENRDEPDQTHQRRAGSAFPKA